MIRVVIGFVALSFVVGAVALPSPAEAKRKNEWQKNSKRCMDLFRDYDAVSHHELFNCVALWEAYRNPKKVREHEKLVALQAFNFLCAQGDDEQAFMAEQAIVRLGDKPKPECLRRHEAAAKVETPAAPSAPTQVEPKPRRVVRQKYDPAPVSAAATKRARGLNSKGHRADKRGKSAKALGFYERAIEADPRYEIAIYNAACVFARTQQESSAMEYLRRLSDLSTDDALDRLRTARRDEDFGSVRHKREFKLLTGYAKIKLMNSKGEKGEDEIDRIEELLAKADYPVAETGAYSPDLPYPVIWHKPGPAKTTAVILSRLLNHPQVRFDELPEDRPFDIAIVWGDTFEINKRTGMAVPPDRSHRDEERELNKVRDDQNKALRDPEKYARTAEDKAREPERVINKVDNTVNRVKSTGDSVERAGKAVDKVDKMFK